MAMITRTAGARRTGPMFDLVLVLATVLVAASAW